MRYILIPITMFVWYSIAYFGLNVLFLGLMFMFSIPWFFLILGYSLLIGILFTISIGLPGLLRLLIMHIYGTNWFPCIVHSVAGLFGIIQFIRLLIVNPPQLVADTESIFFLKGMWSIAPIKTIFISALAFGFIISFFWSNVLMPVSMKLSEEEM